MATSYGIDDLNYVMSMTKWEFDLLIDGIKLRLLREKEERIEQAILISRGFSKKPRWNNLLNDVAWERERILFGKEVQMNRVDTEAELNKALTGMIKSKDMTNTFKEI